MTCLEGRHEPSLGTLLAELRDRIRSVARIVTTALLVLGAAAAAVPVVGAVTGDVRVVPILSGSMAPAIEAGDAVVLRKMPLAAVREGDVITYRIPIGDRHLTTHRVIEVVQKGRQPVVRTKGDANAAPDAWVARLTGDALWRVEATVPRVGHAIVLADRPWIRTGGIWGITALALAFALSAVWRTPPPKHAGHHSQAAVPTA